MPRFVIALLLMTFFARGGEFTVNGRQFTLPDGFEVELAAAPPMIERPIVADFDELGRLYVADSSGSNDKVEKQLAEKPHRIVRLEDRDDDGRFETSTLFADRMMFPEGAMWFDGSLYVAAPPSIWKLTDRDGDGVADRREEWFKGGTLTGCANDLHGPYLGPDGWIYWCKGAFAKQSHQIHGQPFTTRASHIFRARPDGSGLEPVMTGGMDNPVELVFTPEGERIFTTTFFQHPAGGLRDGLIHAVYGGLYGKPHDVLDGHVRTGELMPVLTHVGPAAPSGLARYASDVFGGEYRNNLFAALFNLHKVTRHVLSATGATFQTRDEDFLVGHDTDFHPTDVLEDADGSLLIIDTGGWYKLCCPTSQLHKPDVLGGIYRVRRRGAVRVEDPRGLRIPWAQPAPAEFAKSLADPRPSVVARTISELAKCGGKAVPTLQAALQESASPEARRNAVWALTRIDTQAAREAVRSALGDREASVQHAAAHSASVWRDAGSSGALLKLLGLDAQPQLQRVAAEALGRLGKREVVPPLLAAMSHASRELEHSQIYALIELGDPAPLAAALKEAAPAVRKAALIALDQIKGGKLRLEDVQPWLFSEDKELRKTAAWIAGHHPEWAEEIVTEIVKSAADRKPKTAEFEELVALLTQFSAERVVQDAMTRIVRSTRPPDQQRALVLRTMARARFKELPAEWAVALAEAIAAQHEDELADLLAALGGSAPPKDHSARIAAALLTVGRATNLPEPTRLTALAAVPAGAREFDPQTFDFLCAQLASTAPLMQRRSAAAILGGARLTTEQQLTLVDQLKPAAVGEIAVLLGAFENSSDEALGRRLIAALQAAPAALHLAPGAVKPRLNKFPASVQEEAETLLVTLGADPRKQRADLEVRATSLKNGDLRRGQAVFNSARAACSLCHAIGYLGGNLGPDLTRIGQIRNERDLLEAIIYPSASFVRSFEPAVIVMKAGDEHTGILRKDAPDEVVLANGPATELHLTRADIAEVRPGTISSMPPGYDQILNEQELADLIAFLKASR